MREPFELEVGEIVELGDESYVCVKDVPYSMCSRCDFFHTIHCCEFTCIAEDREDKTDVRFAKQRKETKND